MPATSTDPGENEALKLYNDAIAKGMNPDDIAGDIVSGSDKKGNKESAPAELV